MNEAILRLEHLQHGYEKGHNVLEDVSLALMPGEMVALVAPSGSGKSTLLHIAGLLEPPTTGSVLIKGVECSKGTPGERTRKRRAHVGFMYQFHHLQPEFSVRENVMIPCMIAGRGVRYAQRQADTLLERVGLQGKESRPVRSLSGGEQQRVALARALAHEPDLLLADEPTGNLDPRTALSVLEVLMSLMEGTQRVALIATHNLEIARRMHRVISLVDGRARSLAL